MLLRTAVPRMWSASCTRAQIPPSSVIHEGRTDTALTLASTKQGEREVCHATVELIMGALAACLG